MSADMENRDSCPYFSIQASPEEIALVRDLMAWAKKPAQLPETAPGGTVSLNITAINNTGVDAASIKLTLLDPDKNVIAEQTVGASLAAGASATVPFFYAAPTTAPVGIYHVDYTLLDAAGVAIQPRVETDSGRFAVSNP